MSDSPGPSAEEPNATGLRPAPRRELNCQLRLAFLAGAEERSQRTLGRGLTEDELQRVLDRYPGDAGEVRGAGFR